MVQRALYPAQAFGPAGIFDRARQSLARWRMRRLQARDRVPLDPAVRQIEQERAANEAAVDVDTLCDAVVPLQAALARRWQVIEQGEWQGRADRASRHRRTARSGHEAGVAAEAERSDAGADAVAAHG